MFTDETLQKKYQAILPHLNEQTTRLYLASEAQTLGRGENNLWQNWPG